jgi:hypothetical protein
MPERDEVSQFVTDTFEQHDPIVRVYDDGMVSLSFDGKDVDDKLEVGNEDLPGDWFISNVIYDERGVSFYIDTATTKLSRFQLVRYEDESGVSGTGVVAEGVEFPSGACVFEWFNDENPDLDTTQNGLTVKPGPDGAEDLVEVHGHEGRTKLEWLDEP